jgi:hypothetical protein
MWFVADRELRPLERAENPAFTPNQMSEPPTPAMKIKMSSAAIRPRAGFVLDLETAIAR